MIYSSVTATIRLPQLQIYNRDIERTGGVAHSNHITHSQFKCLCPFKCIVWKAFENTDTGEV